MGNLIWNHNNYNFAKRAFKLVRAFFPFSYRFLIKKITLNSCDGFLKLRIVDCGSKLSCSHGKMIIKSSFDKIESLKQPWATCGP